MALTRDPGTERDPALHPDEVVTNPGNSASVTAAAQALSDIRHMWRTSSIGLSVNRHRFSSLRSARRLLS